MENDAMDHDKKQQPSPGQETPPISKSRRRLVLVTAPVILAVANRPAWANMCSISGAMSGPNSGSTVVTACAGLTPGFWKANADRWPLAYPGFQGAGMEDPLTGECLESRGDDKGKSTCKYWDNSGTTFDQCFGPGNAAALDLPWEDYIENTSDITLMNLLWAGTRGNATLSEVAGAHICAGLLNAAYYIEEYGYNVPQFVTLVNNALAGTYPTGINSLEEFKDMLDTMNNRTQS